MEKIKEILTCLFCNELTTSDLRITNELNSIILSLFDKENLTLFNYYICSECHICLMEAKDILTLLDQFQSRLRAITTSLRNVMNEKSAITSNSTDARFQLLNFGHEFETVQTLKDPLSLEDEEETYNYTECDDNSYELGNLESDCGQSPANLQSFDSQCNKNNGSLNQTANSNPSLENEDIENNAVKIANRRSRNLSDAESSVLWKEYLKRRHKSKNGEISSTVWSEIARIVSMVDDVKRTPKLCKSRIIRLKEKLNKGNNNTPVWLKYDEVDERKKMSWKTKFSDTELSTLWKEYLNRRRKKESGNLSMSVWSEIAQIVSMVDDVKRTTTQCRQRLKMLKMALNKKEANTPVWLKYDDEVGRSERISKQRTSKFSAAESSLLWKEYLRRRPNMQNGTLSFRILSKIAKVVSKVDNVKRTPKQCRHKLQNLKFTLYKASGNSDKETNIPAWLKYEEVHKDERQTSESESKDTSEVESRITEKFSISEIRILWDEYMKRETEIKEAPPNERAKIWNEIAKILSSRCKIPRTFEQCRGKVQDLRYSGGYLKYGLSQPGHHLDVVAKQEPFSKSPTRSVYFTITQNGPVELKRVVMELPKCDAFLQSYNMSNISSTSPNYRIKKLRERLHRLKKTTNETEEQTNSAENDSEKGNNVVDMPYECSNCPKKYRTQRSLTHHDRKSHPVRHKCLATSFDLSFLNPAHHETHIKHEHTEIEIQPEQTCELDGC